MRSSENELYRLVQRARESCAGDSIRARESVIEMIDEAIAYTDKYDAHIDIWNKLRDAKKIMKTVREYVDRLPADRILSSLLNEELKGFG